PPPPHSTLFPYTTLFRSPFQERGAPGQSRTEAGQQHVVALLDAVLAERLLQGQRDRRRGGVAVLVDVDGDLLHRQPDAPRSRVRSEEHTSELQSQSNLVC